jgi:hypothetical protein
VFCFLVGASSEKAIQPPIYFGIGDQLRFESKLGPNLFSALSFAHSLSFRNNQGRLNQHGLLEM